MTPSGAFCGALRLLKYSPQPTQTETRPLAPSWQVWPVYTCSSGYGNGSDFQLSPGIVLTSLGAIQAPSFPRRMFLMQEPQVDLSPTQESKNNAKSKCKMSAPKLSH